jgi:hypothetical protein
MNSLLFALLLQMTGTITFTGHIISLDTPKTTQVQTTDTDTVANTPLLAYYSTYNGGPVQVETITYE